MLPIPPGDYEILDISGHVEKMVTSERAGLPMEIDDTPQFIIRK